MYFKVDRDLSFDRLSLRLSADEHMEKLHNREAFSRRCGRFRILITLLDIVRYAFVIQSVQSTQILYFASALLIRNI